MDGNVGIKRGSRGDATEKTAVRRIGDIGEHVTSNVRETGHDGDLLP